MLILFQSSKRNQDSIDFLELIKLNHLKKIKKIRRNTDRPSCK